MSIALMEKVWDEGPSDRTQAQALAMIANYADDTGRAFPGIATIARRTRLDERTVRRALRELEAAGWLRTVKGGGRKSQDHGRPSQYFIQLDRFTKAGNTPPLTVDQGGPVVQVKGACGAGKGGTTPPEPSGTISNPDRVRGAFIFEDFWNRCPNRVSRTKAAFVWGELSDEDKEAAIAHVEAYYRDWAKAKPELSTPNPITYLERRAWKDLVGAPSATGKTDAEFLKDLAELVNSERDFPRYRWPGPKVSERLIAEGLVTPARLAARCR